MPRLEYFGTDLRDYGHFYWDIEDGWFEKSKRRTSDLPFDPEELPGQTSKDAPQFGNVYFGRHGKFTVLGIYGSPTDHRLGTQSVFFVEHDYSYLEMIDRIVSSKIGSAILRKMPFEVGEHHLNFKNS